MENSSVVGITDASWLKREKRSLFFDYIYPFLVLAQIILYSSTQFFVLFDVLLWLSDSFFSIDYILIFIFYRWCFLVCLYAYMYTCIFRC
jgi:hypothetical protein